MIQFLLNQTKIVLHEHAADITVLDYLRNEQNLQGTKEGCASGDCGACTVVVAEISGEQLKYRSINSCITFIGTLHGRQLITVEHLARENELHPVQRAMVELHGSQCGYCTPGFIMSMFALYKSIEKQSGTPDDSHLRRRIENYLGGNLCRCTGYRPIVDAAISSVSTIHGDQFSEAEQSVFDTLSAIQQEKQGMDLDSFFSPDSIPALNSCINNHPQARLVAGSTDLALEVTQQLKYIPKMIYLGMVEELQSVVHDDTQLEIGSAVTLSQCQKVIGEYFPETSELFDRFGSRQIRNQGTIGGNIANASPIGDLPPMLIAMKAVLRLQKDKTVRELPIEKYFKGYQKTALAEREFIRSILIPLPSPGQTFRIYKISKRLDDDISAVCLAISLHLSAHPTPQITDARVALGGMDAIPRRAAQCESALVGKELNEHTIALAAVAIARDFKPISDARASASYRIEVAKNLLTRFYLEVSQPQITTRVEQHYG